MLRERIIDFLKDFFYVMKRVLTSRVIPFVAVGAIMFGILIYRLFVLQIVNGESYTNDYTLKAEKTVSTNGTRGSIYDSKNRLLAYSELAYSVVIKDAGTYKTKAEKNEKLNRLINKATTIIVSNGDTVDYDFGINVNKKGEFYYSLEGNSLLRFLRDIYGKKAISDLTEEERNATASVAAAYLCNLYQIKTGEKSDPDNNIYSNKDASYIFYVRYNLAANSYKRYVNFKIANNVNSNTMASILENSDTLIGVSISEDTVRKYNYGFYISHIIGYTGKISSDQLEELQMLDSSYSANDVVGKSGIEEAYETTLAGKKGEKTILVDNVGRELETTSEIPSEAGKDVYLTIDIELQEKIYKLLERRLAEIVYSYIYDGETVVQEDNQIFIPIKDVYFALINNNTIDTQKIAVSESEAAKMVYSVFAAYKEQVLISIVDDLNNGAAYNTLSPEMQKYIKLIRNLLINNNFIDSEKISASNDIQTKWSNGEISFRDYLRGIISNQWVNIYNLDLNSDYPTVEEVLVSLIEEAKALITDSREFDKLLYEYLIDNHYVNGRELCLILMEQSAINYTESEYLNIQNGGSTLDFLKEKIKNLDITPAQLALDPCQGSCVVEDPNTGKILAMVSYPSYDINYFSGTINADYYAKLLEDKSTPLVNRATQTKIAPGSTFKPLMAIAGINEGVIGATENVFCDGIYDKIVPNIKCWIYPKKHKNVHTETALEHSCNEYFCEIGYRLCMTNEGELNFSYGLSRIKKYAELFGLGTKSGIQIPEATPKVSDYNAVASAIGQGTNAYTSLNLARYVSTIANSGTVYNSSIISKISNSDKTEYEITNPVVANTVDIDPSIWTTVHNGMYKVIQGNDAMKELTSSLPVSVFSKSGTAQEDKTRGDHACYIMFSKDDTNNPELAVSVMIPYGHSATHAGIMAYYATAAYYGAKTPSWVVFDTKGKLHIEN